MHVVARGEQGDAILGNLEDKHEAGDSRVSSAVSPGLMRMAVAEANGSAMLRIRVDSGLGALGPGGRRIVDRQLDTHRAVKVLLQDDVAGFKPTCTDFDSDIRGINPASLAWQVRDYTVAASASIRVARRLARRVWCAGERHSSLWVQTQVHVMDVLETCRS